MEAFYFWKNETEIMVQSFSNVVLHIFKIKDKKNSNSEHFTKPFEIFGTDISK